MRRLASIVSVLALTVVMPGLCRADQAPLEFGKGRLPTSSDLVAQAGDERLVPSILKTLFEIELYAQTRPCVVRLAKAQVREEWLPKIEGVRFVLMSDEEVAAAFESCGGCWFLRPIVRTPDRLVAEISHGNRCSVSSSSYPLRLDDGSLVVPGSFGSSLTGGSHCDCNP